jgi:glycogen debranching enzyme
MMTISTAAQAEAEGQYGRIEQMLGYIDQIISTFSIRMPGSFSEMSPDYGCFVQAWTGYGVIWPIVTYLFGIQPCAYKKEIRFNPIVPGGWDSFGYKNVKIGTATFNFYYKRNENNEESFIIECDEEGWKINSRDEILSKTNFINI